MKFEEERIIYTNSPSFPEAMQILASNLTGDPYITFTILLNKWDWFIYVIRELITLDVMPKYGLG